jgi:Tol biopolymer transport system component
MIVTVVGASMAVIAGKGGGGGGGGGKPGGGGKENPAADPQIAYIPTQGSDGAYELYVMNEDGSNRVAIYSTNMALSSPCWNSDGTGIAFIQWGDIWTIDVSVVNGVPQGSNPTQVTKRAPSIAGRHYYSIDRSPTDDNKYTGMCNDFYYENDVLVSVTREFNLITINGNTVTETQLMAPFVSSSYHSIESPTFSTDGTKIAYGENYVFSDTVDHWAWIRIIDLTLTPSDPGYKSTVFFREDGIVTNLDWANTADTVAFYFQPWYSTMYDGFHTIAIDFSSGTPVGGTPVFRLSAYDTSWSPDDTKFVYEGSAKGNGNAIFTFELANLNSQQLVKNAGNFLDLDWSRA